MGPATFAVAAEPADVAAAYREHARAQGRAGEAAEIACRSLAEALSVCFTWEESVPGGTVRRYVTTADLKTWGLDLAAVEAKAAPPGPIEPVAVEGISGRFWTAEGTGLLLHPEGVAAASGASPVVAVPSGGSLLFWVPGDRELDIIMAVGVRRMYEAAEHPVSPLVYRWDVAKQSWTVWGEAKAQAPGGL